MRQGGRSTSIQKFLGGEDAALIREISNRHTALIIIASEKIDFSPAAVLQRKKDTLLKTGINPTHYTNGQLPGSTQALA